MSKAEIRILAEEALDAFWDVLLRRFPEATDGDLSPERATRLMQAAEEAIEEWINNNVPQSADEPTKRDAAISTLFTHLDNNHLRLEELGCFVALSADRTRIFSCPMMADGSPERDADAPQHLNWGEVTAPEPAFVESVNKSFGASFRWEDFAGR